jgi:EamA domain-containing membrane protein RarD
MTDLFILGASILFIISIFQYHSLTTYILITLWSVPPIILTLILRKRFTSLVTISKNPRKLPSLKIRDLLIIVPLCVFGWVSVFVIIEIYNQARKDERKYAPWWRLKEYGGKF